MAPVEGRNVRTNTMFSIILAVLFIIKILASFSQICRLSKNKIILALMMLFWAKYICFENWTCAVV